MGREERYVDPMVAELKQIRVDNKVQQQAAASEIGIGASMLSAYENGAVSPQLATIRAWSARFGRDVVLTSKSSTTASVSDEILGRTSVVRLSQYQTALAMGMLLAEASRNSSSPGMAAELYQIADILAKSLH